MKNKTKKLSLLTAALFALSALVSVVAFADDSVDLQTAFPDPVFRDAIALEYDTDGDGKLSPEERSTQSMLVSGLVDELAESRGVDSDTLTISSIEGIEHFENLKVLYCNNIGELASLDVSALTNLETLNCSDDGLTSLDVSANTALRKLHCCSNEFTSLDLSANTNLEFLHCYANLQLTSLNVSGLTKLEELRCHGCQLTSLDLSTNTALTVLNCSYNKLSQLDLSNTQLNSLTDYHIGNQKISLEMVWANDRIEAPLALDSNAVYSTSLDDGETAYADGAFFTNDYSKIEDGFTYLYSTGRSGCAEMKVAVDVYHTHTYAVTSSDFENNKLTVNCLICGGDEHILDAEFSVSTVNPDCTTDGKTTRTLTAEFNSEPYESTEETVLPALGHDYKAVVTAPTCTAQGYTTYTCTRCPDSYVDTYVDATGHSYGEWTETIAPTCTAKGEEKRECANCDAFETREVDALGHDYKAVVTNPTCTAQGYTTHTCTRCPDSYVDTYVNATGHSYGEWTETTAPTCTTKGEEKRECANCDAYETREVNALGHDYKAVVTNPTCTEQGYTTHTCTRCPDSYVDTYVDATGHSYGEWTETTAPTCTAKGEEKRECANCDAYETREVNALGHDYKAVVTNPTCTAQGYTTHTCTRCPDSYVDTCVDATGHSYGEWTETTAPTCTVKGEEKRECANCDAFETRDVDALGHDYKAVVTNPTCTAQGYTTHTCTRCPDSYVDTCVDATGHSYGEWTETTAPTCTTKGEEKRECANCDAYETREVNALGHDYKAVVTNPTCTEQGYTTHTCSRCQDAYTDSETDALGHDYHAVVIDPTCTEQGYTTHTCSRCQDAYTDSETDALGHDYHAAVTDPTCTEQGYTTHTCSRCQDAYTDSETDALGHSWNGGTVTIQPTVSAEGKKKYTCTECGATRYEAIPKLTVKEVTPTEAEADKATVNKNIKKPDKIHTISKIKKKQLYIYFNPVKNAQNYRVMYRKQGAKKWTKSWTKGKTEYTIKNLKANGLYEFKFAAYKKNAAGKWERGAYSTTSYRYFNATAISKVKVSKNTATVTWKRNKNATNYTLEYATNKDMKNSKKVTISPNSKTSYKIKGLKKGKTYYIRIRSNKKKSGKTYIGEYSARKTVKIK